MFFKDKGFSFWHQSEGLRKKVLCEVSGPAWFPQTRTCISITDGGSDVPFCCRMPVVSLVSPRGLSAWWDLVKGSHLSPFTEARAALQQAACSEGSVPGAH